MRSKVKVAVEMRVCHCGKCRIKCNKHGKRGKCEECGKIRMLGTEAKNGIVRHICGECCDRLIEIQRIKQEKIDRQIENEFKRMRHKKRLLEIHKTRTEKDERCIVPKKKEEACGLDIKIEKVKRPKRKLKESS